MTLATRILAGTVAAAALAAATPAYAAWTSYDGPARWESTTVTISSEVPGVDLAAITSPWGDTVTLLPTTGPADIVLVPAGKLGAAVGGEARKTFHDGNYIEHCEIQVVEPTPEILTHELGHCLGLHHSTDSATNMRWIAFDYQGGWSDTVTDSDRATLARLYS